MDQNQDIASKVPTAQSYDPFWLAVLVLLFGIIVCGAVVFISVRIYMRNQRVFDEDRFRLLDYLFSRTNNTSTRFDANELANKIADTYTEHQEKRNDFLVYFSQIVIAIIIGILITFLLVLKVIPGEAGLPILSGITGFAIAKGVTGTKTTNNQPRRE